MTIELPLSALTLDAVQAEALRAHLKHGAKSVLNPDMPVIEKLAALVEEVGEVARVLTYDHATQVGSQDELVKELNQVASVALSWIESIEGANRHRYTEGSTTS